MATTAEINEACSLLETDILRHIVALKMIALHGPESELAVRRDGAEWGVLALLPTALVLWDRKTYPTAALSAFVDGSGPAAALSMLDLVPRARVVVKTAEPEVGRVLAERGAKRMVSILSFSRGPDTPRPVVAPEVTQSDVLDDEAIGFFGENDYEPEELAGYFSHGAQRFFVREGVRTVAACFVFENYKRVWEVAGVRTVPDRCGRGLAKKATGAAIAYLDETGRVPRYQTLHGNIASLAVARSLGLTHFLTQEHFLWDRRRWRR